MKNLSQWLRQGQHLLQAVLLTACLLGAILPAQGASTIENDALVVDVTAGVRRVKVEHKSPNGTWKLIGVAYTDGRVGKVKLRLPSADIALADLRVSTTDDAPLSFINYLQNTRYSNFDQNNQDQNNQGKINAMGEWAGTTTDSVSGERVGDVTVTESDIWKLDGKRLYYFNSLRGLQIIDLSDASAPELTGRVRMPGRGEQFYLLDSTHLALLASEQWGGQGSVLVVNASDPALPVITHELPLRGYVNESRLVGDTLYVATSAYELKDAANSQSGYIQVTYLTRIDLSDPANPAQTGQYALDGYVTALTATPDAFIIVTQIDRYTQDGNIRNYWNPYSLVSVFPIGDPAATLAPNATVTTTGYIQDKFKLNLKGTILTTISNETWKWNARRTLLETFQLTNFTPASAKRSLSKLADIPTPPTEPPPPLPPTLKPPVVVTPPPPPPPLPVLPDPTSATRLAQLELAPGESLFATRFDGNKAYIVTFLRKDPLFILDLSNPANPTVSGKLDIPGYSTLLLPHNNRLIGIGVQDRNVTVVLFDVSNPLSPSELQRIKIGSETGYTWSEGNYDDKAVSFLPEQNLLMLPYTSYDWQKGTQESAIQLVDLNDTNLDGSFDSLTKRGTITHSQAARRATALDTNTLVSVSSRELITVNAADRSTPAVLATTTLAWSSDYVIRQGDHLVQIENGNSGYYYSYASSYNAKALATITTTDSMDEPLGVVDLGVTNIVGTAVKDDRLYIASVIAQVYPENYNTLPEPRPAPTPAQFVTSIYDLSQLPALPLLGSAQQALPQDESGYSIGTLAPHWLSTGELLWYGNGYSNYGWDWCGTTSGIRAADGIIGRGGFYYGRSSSGYLITVSVSDPAHPAILATLNMASLLKNSYTYDPAPEPNTPIIDVNTVVTSVSEYFQGGFFISGDTAWIAKTNSTYVYKWNWVNYNDSSTSITHYLYAVPLSAPTTLIASEPVAIPGRLLGVNATSASDATLFSSRFVQTKIEWVKPSETSTYTYPVIEGYNALQSSLYDGMASYLTQEMNVSDLEPGYWQDTKCLGTDSYVIVQSLPEISSTSYVTKIIHLTWDGQNFSRAGSLEMPQATSIIGLFDGYFVTSGGDFKLLQPDTDGDLQIVASATVPYGLYSVNWAQSALDFPTSAWIASGSYGSEYIGFTQSATPLASSQNRGVKSRLAAQVTDRATTWKQVDTSALGLTGAATAADSVGKLSQRDWLYRASEAIPLTSNATDLGDGVHASAWLGTYYDELYPWVRHDTHGWLYAVPYEGTTGVDSFFFWQTPLGWTWVGSDIYGYVYNFDRAAWLYYWPDSGANGTPRYFFNCSDTVRDWEVINP
ncbi:MAG: beta-propeller domain-containing protein [Verrucomicrobiota bacterium]|nr:beta-propeller domain-containing protein [Verrucomicrobiota bacterium]